MSPLLVPPLDPDSPVPHPLVTELLYSRTSVTGYRCVYPKGARLYSAHAKIGGRKFRIPGSTRPLPHQAAVYVLKWYLATYGPDHLRDALRRRKGHAPPWRVRRSARRGGFVAAVWERGVEVRVVGRRKPGAAGDPFDTPANCLFALRHWRVDARAQPGGRLLVFATREGAADAARAWFVSRWGDLADAAAARPCDAGPDGWRAGRAQVGRAA